MNMLPKHICKLGTTCNNFFFIIIIHMRFDQDKLDSMDLQTIYLNAQTELTNSGRRAKKCVFHTHPFTHCNRGNY